jgi:hypothetical protein
MSDTSVDFEAVQHAELDALRRRRRQALGRKYQPRTVVADDPGAAAAHRERPFGLAFSGGGIRSATFNLGIIQGLAERDLLRHVDYLSTVSGGGYIGAWLHGYIKQHCQNDLRKATCELSPSDNPVPKPPQDDPISFLRKYSNYLAPRPGLFSADTWVIGTIWLRNVLLNQLILLPALGAVVLSTFLFYYLQMMPVAALLGRPLPDLVMPAVAVLAIAFAAQVAWHNLDSIVARCWPTGTMAPATPDWWERRGPWVAPVAVFFAAVVLGCGDTGARLAAPGGDLVFALAVLGAAFYGLYLLLQFRGGFVRQYQHVHDDQTSKWGFAHFHPFWMSAVAAGLLVWLLHLIWSSSAAWEPWTRVALAPPLVSVAVMTSVSLLVGLMGADYPDGAREWVARSGALLTLVSAAWLVLFGVAFFGPYFVAWALGTYGKSTVSAIVAWIATGTAGVAAGSSSKTGGVQKEKPSATARALGVLVSLAPTLIMVAYLLLIAAGGHAALATAEPVAITITRSGQASGLDASFEGARLFAESYHDVLRPGPVADRLQSTGLLMLACILVAWVASARININEFSLHNFYKNRLVRCYLGASQGRSRRPNPLTGFDPQDDFPLSVLKPEHGYPGPQPIVNTALNLNTGSELAQQERKAASFVLTPHYCGFEPQASAAPAPAPFMVRDEFQANGYRKTSGEHFGYSDPKGPSVGQGMAISGAAASPNSGYSTSGPMAFLLTIFDARLGWWLGNPRWKQASRRPGPSFALKYLLAELTANTTARTRFVSLSDGGHYDNLGLYELVRRRCRYIIIGDGEQDGDLTFGSLGGAIRKVRADFGVEIAIDPHLIRMNGEYSPMHCVVGTITYPELDPDQPVPMTGQNGDAGYGSVKTATSNARGWLLYLKSSLTGNEPADVIEYKSRNSDFPHQSTGDQFFSEAQFESYRRLGLHILREAFEGVSDVKVGNGGAAGAQVPIDDLPLLDLTHVFQQLTVKWYPRNPLSHEAASRLNDGFTRMVQRLTDDKLQELLPAVLAQIDGAPTWRMGPPDPKQFVYWVEQLQLMENVFFEFGFEQAANRANPRNRGWMKVFRQWVESPQFYEGLWPRVRHSYNPVFQGFIDRLHAEAIDDVPSQN